MAVSGNVGCGRVLVFVSWVLAITIVGAIWPENFIDQKKKGPSIPLWLGHLWGGALIIFLCYHGWVWTAIALTLHEIGVVAIFMDREEASDE
jgi:hypothetical protein